MQIKAIELQNIPIEKDAPLNFFKHLFFSQIGVPLYE